MPYVAFPRNFLHYLTALRPLTQTRRSVSDHPPKALEARFSAIANNAGFEERSCRKMKYCPRTPGVLIPRQDKIWPVLIEMVFLTRLKSPYHASECGVCCVLDSYHQATVTDQPKRPTTIEKAMLTQPLQALGVASC